MIIPLSQELAVDIVPGRAFEFFRKYSNVSEKTRFFSAAVSSAASAGPKLQIIECGAQRSAAKQTLFSDGWSTTLFMSLRTTPMLVSVDPLYASQSISPLKGTFLPVSEKMETAIPFLLSESRTWDVVLLDGPDDPRVTNDCLCYLAEVTTPLMVVMDDVNTKVSAEALRAMRSHSGSSFNRYSWVGKYQTEYSKATVRLEYDIGVWLLNYNGVQAARVTLALSDFNGTAMHSIPTQAFLI